MQLRISTLGSVSLLTTLLVASTTMRAADPQKVTVFNFVRAESDLQMKAYAARAGGVGQLNHMREMYSVEPDQQPTIRGNRDTLYSAGVFDLTQPLTISKPDSAGRFQSMMFVSQDHSIFPAVYDAGEYTLTQEMIGTRYVLVLCRTFANPNDPADMRASYAVQDGIRLSQADRGALDLPAWDVESLNKIRAALNVLAADVDDTDGYFGIKSKIDPIKHLLGTAYGWGGNPKQDAMYINRVPAQNDGQTGYVLNVKEVPVDGFWSVTVYNAKGFFEKNQFNAYSFNNYTAQPNQDGSFTIHFGGDPRSKNFLPITPGWNFIVRLYRPRQELLNGSWKFPDLQLAK